MMDIKQYRYISAADFMASDGNEDVADKLQQLIDTHPNHTIFFPDGIYLLSHPVLTPASPQRSVDLQLSNFAHMKAAEDWNSKEAMIRLGAKDFANDIYTPGSNYGISGGIIDGSGKAKGISIDGGRETYIRNVNIKNVQVGVHIKYGANSGSSDADILSVNVTGNGSPDSVGVLIEGFDNTLTNMRIANVFTGVRVCSGGNMLRNIHPLFIIDPSTYSEYEESIGFRIEHGMNWFDYCYSDQFAVGFDTLGGGILKNCFCWWYSDKEKLHLAVRSHGSFYGSIDTMVIGGAQHPEYPNQFMDPVPNKNDDMIDKVTRVMPDGSVHRIR